jgi:hypothetical protein
MNEVVVEPDGSAVKRFIERSVENFVDTPVAYEFESEWPAELSVLEAEEVLDAVGEQPVRTFMPHDSEHKRIAIECLKEAIRAESFK